MAHAVAVSALFLFCCVSVCHSAYVSSITPTNPPTPTANIGKYGVYSASPRMRVLQCRATVGSVSTLTVGGLTKSRDDLNACINDQYEPMYQNLLCQACNNAKKAESWVVRRCIFYYLQIETKSILHFFLKSGFKCPLCVLRFTTV